MWPNNQSPTTSTTTNHHNNPSTLSPSHHPFFVVPSFSACKSGLSVIVIALPTWRKILPLPGRLFPFYPTDSTQPLTSRGPPS